MIAFKNWGGAVVCVKDGSRRFIDENSYFKL